MATDTRVFFVWGVSRSRCTYLEWRVNEHSSVGGWLVLNAEAAPNRWYEHATIGGMTMATYIRQHKAAQITKCKARKLLKQHGIKATI